MYISKTLVLQLQVLKEIFPLTIRIVSVPTQIEIIYDGHKDTSKYKNVNIVITYSQRQRMIMC